MRQLGSCLFLQDTACKLRGRELDDYLTAALKQTKLGDLGALQDAKKYLKEVGASGSMLHKLSMWFCAHASGARSCC